MDLSDKWNQPFLTKTKSGIIYTLCNWEIYNYKEIIKKYNFQVKSGSDCEVIPLLYTVWGIQKVLEEIKWEFAFIIYDQWLRKLFVARDPIWVRPLFFGKWKLASEFGFCSQLKWLSELYADISQFKPWTYLIYDLEKFEVEQTEFYSWDYKIKEQTKLQIQGSIVDIFTKSVQKRLMSDRPLWCLLSGWLDSSICSAIAQKYSKHQIKTFTIWMDWATDTPFAEKVANYIWSDHKTFLISPEEALLELADTIRTIESFDITTVRASTRQYILAKKIKHTTDIKVLLCWELSDELMWWYKYFHKSPDLLSFDLECKRLVRDVFLYDGLRTDRTMSENGLEVRLPFADVDFVNYFFSIPIKHRVPQNWIEKYLFRKSFDKTNILPSEVLWRSKEALSDGTSSKQKSWFEVIQEHIDKIISDQEFEKERLKYLHCMPQTKEAYYYRKIFDYYFGEKHSNVIPYFWLPKWCGNITDPSARVIKEVYK